MVDELKYLGVLVQTKRNVFQIQRNEMMNRMKRLSVMSRSIFRDDACHRKKVAMEENSSSY